MSFKQFLHDDLGQASIRDQSARPRAGVAWYAAWVYNAKQPAPANPKARSIA